MKELLFTWAGAALPFCRVSLWTPSSLLLESKALSPQRQLVCKKQLAKQRKLWLLSSAVEVQREGAGDELTDLRRYHPLHLFYFSNHSSRGFLRASSFSLTPYYETDLKNDINSVVGSLEWEPQLALGRFQTGVWQELFPGPRKRSGRSLLQYSIVGRLGLEGRDVTRRPSGSSEASSFYSKLSFQGGLLLRGRLQLLYERTMWHAFKSGQSSPTLQRWTLSYPLDREKRYSLVASYKHGASSPASASTRNYNASLGVAF